MTKSLNIVPRWGRAASLQPYRAEVILQGTLTNCVRANGASRRRHLEGQPTQTLSEDTASSLEIGGNWNAEGAGDVAQVRPLAQEDVKRVQ